MALNFGTYFDGGKVVKAGGESVAFKPEDHEVIGEFHCLLTEYIM
jgi:hypothetical protein